MNSKNKQLEAEYQNIHWLEYPKYSLLENNVRITAKLFKLNFQGGRNFSILIEACGALSLRVDRAPLREYLSAAGWWRCTL